MMKWIGLTGGIGTGKSSAASILRELGLPVVDADALAHKSFEKDTDCYHSIVKLFGNKILAPDLNIDRKILGQIVFSNKTDLTKLENIVHPYVQDRANEIRREYEAGGQAIAFYDVPLLFEKELQGKFDKTLLVYANPNLQFSRLERRDSLEPSEIQKRIAAQIPIDKKREMADYVVDNSGSLLELKNKIKEIAKILVAE